MAEASGQLYFGSEGREVTDEDAERLRRLEAEYQEALGASIREKIVMRENGIRNLIP